MYHVNMHTVTAVDAVVFAGAAVAAHTTWDVEQSVALDKGNILKSLDTFSNTENTLETPKGTI